MGESEALAKLLSRWPENKINPSLNRISAILSALGSPEQSFKGIHLAGTNGKTSSARMVQQLLLELNLRVGLYTSPHLKHPRERILVDGQAISESDFENLYSNFEPILNLVEDKLVDEKLTFFEAITAMAFFHFSEIPIEIGVIEVGLGGRWDATNLVNGEINVITPVSFDHKEYLGETLAQIASEKAGILKPGARAVISSQHPEAEAVIRNELIEKNIEAFWQDQDFYITKRELAHGGQIFDVTTPYGTHKDIFLNLFGEFQVQNAAVAICAIEAFFGEKLDSELVINAFEKVKSPGRLEVLGRNPTVLIDASHNPEGIKVSRAAIEESFHFNEVALILGVMEDKEISEMLKNLEQFASRVICTQINSERALNAQKLAKLVKSQLPNSKVSLNLDIESAINEAIEYAKSKQGCGVVVMGSIALAGAVRELL